MQEVYRIVDWWKFEMTAKGRLAKPETPVDQLRIAPLIYVRFPVHGHNLCADYRRMVKRAWNHGSLMAEACEGVYKALVGLAGNQTREFRGFILDDRQRPINPAQVAELLSWSGEKIQTIFEVLMDPNVNWVELVEFPAALQGNVSRVSTVKMGGMPAASSSPENSGAAGLPLNETETEVISSGFDTSNTLPGSPGKSGRGGVGSTEADPGSGSAAGSGDHQQPQALAPATDTGSVSLRFPASEIIPDTVSGPDSVSTFEPGPGPGVADGFGHLTGRDRLFAINKACEVAKFELAGIISCRTSSDRTTVNNIFGQLQQRIISGCKDPLFAMALSVARESVKVADKPMAFFVSAMKKKPFCYVPKRLTVIPKIENERGH